MAENTHVEYAHHSFNPWWGCTKISPACDFCYAERDAKRFSPKQVLWGHGVKRREFGGKHWAAPVQWARKYQNALADWVKLASSMGGEEEAVSRGFTRPERPRVFCASMADIFDNEGPADARGRLWQLIKDTEGSLDWILVTKRIGNAKDMLPADWGKGYPNAWLIATVATQEELDRDLPKLLQVPAKVRGLSMEPLLGRVRLNINLPDERMLRWYRPIVGMLDWIIVGGESGSKARPCNIGDMQYIVEQCEAASVPVFVKQLGANPVNSDGSAYSIAHQKGADMTEWPERLRVRRLPGWFSYIQPNRFNSR